MDKADATADLVTRLLGGAAAILAASLGADPGTALALGATASTLTKAGCDDLMSRFRSAAERRAINCATAIHAGLCQRLASITDEDERRRVAEARASDPAFDDTLFETWRSLITIDDAGVRPCLAYLGAEYSLDSKRPDAFFRAASDVLIATTSDELPTLRQIFEGVARMTEEGDAFVTLIKMTTEPDVGRVYARWEVDPRARGSASGHREVQDLFTVTQKFERVAARLKAKGFAGDADLVDADPHRVLHFDPETLAEIRALLDCVRASPAAFAAG